MWPIVNGLEEQYSPDMAFASLDAADNASGQAAFESLQLPGHPTTLIFTPGGEEIYRGFGVVDEATLEAEIEAALAG